MPDPIRFNVSVKILPDGRVLLPLQGDVELLAAFNGYDTVKDVYFEPVKFGNFSLMFSKDDNGWELKAADKCTSFCTNRRVEV